jgi:hypothetical protein
LPYVSPSAVAENARILSLAFQEEAGGMASLTRAASRQRLPFPVPLSIGTDICSLVRVRKILEDRLAARFIRRVLAPEEIEELEASKHRRWLQFLVERSREEDRTRLDLLSRATSFMAGR